MATYSQPLFQPKTAKRLLLAVCLLVLAGILVAGLSPFTPHLKNQVQWLDGRDGLFFGEYATILGSGPLKLDGDPHGPCSVELFMQAGVIDDSNTMLAFQTREHPLRFSIEQSGSSLELERQESGRHRQKDTERIWIAKVLKQDVPVLITVTAGERGTSVYLDGMLVRSAPDFHLSRHDLLSETVVGNSPVGNDSWSGVLRGIGIYNQELSADQVRRNFDDWTQSGSPHALSEISAVAVYPFTERSGTVIHNLVRTGPNLYIPPYYVVLYPWFLQPFWTHWGWNWAFLQDGLVNVFGFIPFGFVFCTYFALSRPLGRAIILAIVFGCAISFLIEATQFYLPTRDSDSMDFINNVVGSTTGALLLLPRFVRTLLARVGIVPYRSLQPADDRERVTAQECA